MNNYFITKFKNGGFYVDYNNIPDIYHDKQLYVFIKDQSSDISFSHEVKPNYWFIYNNFFNVAFKYDIKLFSFDGNDIKIIDELKFDIKNHDFKLNLVSDNETEINIWKLYIEKLTKILNATIEYSINLPSTDNFYQNYDAFEVSRKVYDEYLLRYKDPFSVDFSSYTIISKIINII